MARAARPPRLDSPEAAARPEAPPAPSEPAPATMLRRSGVAGGRDPQAAVRVRRAVEALAGGDPEALGGLGPFEDLTREEIWRSVEEGWGIAPGQPAIDPEKTLAGAASAGARLARAAAEGSVVCFATAAPASLLPLASRLARLARAAGAAVAEAPDTGWAMIDGRRNRYLRWLDGVAVVTDGEALHGARRADAADELLFALTARPGLVVGDGPFATVALAGGLDVVALAGPEQPVLGVACRRGLGVTLVPLDPHREPGSYAPVAAAVEEAFAGGSTRP